MTRILEIIENDRTVFELTGCDNMSKLTELESSSAASELFSLCGMSQFHVGYAATRCEQLSNKTEQQENYKT